MKGNTRKRLSDSVFIKVLRSFSPSEIKEFEKFIASPFFNSQSTLLKMYREIINYYPEFTDKNFTHELIFGKVNPGKKYNDVIFRKYISNLLRLAEKFLVVTDNLKNNERFSTSLLDQYERRNLYGSFQKLMKSAENGSLEQNEISNESFFYMHYREELKSSLNIRTNNLSLYKSNLIRSHICLLLHLLLTSTVYSNMMIVNSKLFKDSEEIRIFEEFFEIFDIIKYLENSEYINNTEHMFIQLCKNEIFLMKNPYSKIHLDSMKENLLKLSVHLNKNLLYIFFSHLNIFYLLNMTSSSHDYSRELFENYKYMLGKGLYVHEERGFINFSEYRIILIIALKLKEIKWAENFISEFKNHHYPEMSGDIFNYSMASLKFETGKIAEAQKHLSRIKSNDLIMKIDLDLIQLLIFYEEDYIDSAISLSDSFRHFLKTDKILSKDMIRIHKDFIQYYKILLKHKHSGIDEFYYKKYKKEISENISIRRKRWLLEKLDIISEIKN